MSTREMWTDEMNELVAELREQVTILKAERDEQKECVRVLSDALTKACAEAREGYSRGWDGLDRRDALARIAELEAMVDAPKAAVNADDGLRAVMVELCNSADRWERMGRSPGRGDELASIVRTYRAHKKAEAG